jgi:hypothetical protein
MKSHCPNLAISDTSGFSNGNFEPTALIFMYDANKVKKTGAQALDA